MLRMEGASKDYNHRGQAVHALREASVNIPEGDFVAVVGPSGSGKSTLLLVLGGMLSPSAGQVFLNGQSLYDLTPDERARLRREKMGFVFQTFNLVPYLTAMENVQIPLFLAGVDETAQKEKAAGLLGRVGLDGRLDHKPSELSVGQQQRVALARVLANDPAIILADEPTGNLDPDTSNDIMEFLVRMNSEGKTIVMVTHDPRAAQRARRTLKLIEGGFNA
jgi:putative ABC transport system ATP-binding protein